MRAEGADDYVRTYKYVEESSARGQRERTTTYVRTGTGRTGEGAGVQVVPVRTVLGGQDCTGRTGLQRTVVQVVGVK